MMKVKALKERKKELLGAEKERNINESQWDSDQRNYGNFRAEDKGEIETYLFEEENYSGERKAKKAIKFGYKWDIEICSKR